MAGLNISELGTMVPFEVNSVAVGADGRLTRVDPRERPFRFHFGCLGLRFTAATRHHDGDLWLQVSAKAGPLPYSAESPERRQNAFSILRASLGLRHARLGISRDRQIELIGEIPLAARLTPVNVISATTELVLELKPLVGLLNEFVFAGFGRATPSPDSRPRAAARGNPA